MLAFWWCINFKTSLEVTLSVKKNFFFNLLFCFAESNSKMADPCHNLFGDLTH